MEFKFRQPARVWFMLLRLAGSAVFAAVAAAQDQAALTDIVERLQRLERENQAMAEEIRSLRARIAAFTPGTAPTTPPLSERMDVQEQRVEDLAQTKVEAAEKLPVTLEGMVLMNTFWNSRPTAGSENPTMAPAASPQARTYGATFRQSTIGVRYRGPSVAGGRVSGAVSLDLFGGTTASLNHMLRLRTATVQIDWGTRRLMIGQEKPLISERNPTSLAQVGVTPLTNAGNLWLWQPQIRFDQTVNLTQNHRLTGSVGLYETVESTTEVPAQFESSFSRQRPALQGRVEWSYRSGDRQLVALAPGFHYGTSRVAGASAPSALGSFEWLVAPTDRVEWTGLFYSGTNVANMGALRQGFVILGPGQVLPVRGTGGWTQVALRATDRLTFHAYGGQHDDWRRDLRFGGTDKNQAYAANFIYRLVQNVLLSFEFTHLRTNYTAAGLRKNNHYDVAVAYLF
jgi:hypothetical protein